MLYLGSLSPRACDRVRGNGVPQGLNGFLVLSEPFRLESEPVGTVVSWYVGTCVWPLSLPGIVMIAISPWSSLVALAGYRVKEMHYPFTVLGWVPCPPPPLTHQAGLSQCVLQDSPSANSTSDVGCSPFLPCSQKMTVFQPQAKGVVGVVFAHCWVFVLTASWHFSSFCRISFQ